MRIERVLAKHLHPVSVEADEAAEGAHPDHPAPVLRERGHRPVRQAVGDPDGLEQRRVERPPRIGGGGRRLPAQQQRQAEADEQ